MYRSDRLGSFLGASMREFVCLKSNCCPFMSERPAGKTFSSIPTSSGSMAICDMAAEWDMPVASNGILSLVAVEAWADFVTI
eukprot:CCRYP_000914-RF/>CCRYP_000914-RF protein AED:0.49 eAED:1.00 QI:0/0/0/1/0/0/2/0/81